MKRTAREEQPTPAVSLVEYGEILDRVGENGSVSVQFAREILETAAQALQQQTGEHTLARAMEISGRSRSWWEVRLPHMQARRLARKEGGVWLIKDAAIPRRKPLPSGGFTEADDVDAIADTLLRSA